MSEQSLPKGPEGIQVQIHIHISKKHQSPMPEKARIYAAHSDLPFFSGAQPLNTWLKDTIIICSVKNCSECVAIYKCVPSRPT